MTNNIVTPGSPKRLLLAAATASVLAIAAVLGVIYWPRTMDLPSLPEKKDPIAENKPPVVPVAKPDNDGWVSLFNGKDLTGWKSSQPDKWKIANECLVGTDRTTLILERELENFHCRFEAKMEPSSFGNFWFRSKNGHGAVVGLSGKPEHKTGWLRTVSPDSKGFTTQGNGVQIEQDTWFNMDVIVQGKTVEVKVNGKSTVKKSIESLPDSGWLMLNSDAEGKTLHFRKIEIKELPPTPPVAPQPFVVLAKAERKETRHPTLAAAVAAAQSGDTIEVRGNGPFLTGALTLPHASLSIRAGAAYRPIIEQDLQSIDEGNNLLSIHGVLILEGLEFRRDGSGKFVNTGRWSIVRGEKPDAAAYATNCRFICKKSGYCLDQSLHRMTLRNCELFSGWSSVAPSLSLPTEIRIENSILCADQPLRWQLSGPYKGAIYLRENTVVGHTSAWNVRFWDYSDRDRGGPIRFETTRNLFLGKYLVHLEPRKAEQLLQFEDAKNALRESFAWIGNSNIHPSNADGLLSFDPTYVEKNAKIETAIRDLAAWNHFWKDTDTTSQQGQPLFQNANAAKVGLEAPEKLTPGDFRLAKGSPGQGVLPGGKDLGANVDLVGPGAAYERWQKTPAYQEWRKQTDALMATAAAPQPFVVLAKANRAETRHPTLAAAVAAAQSGDTIELQGNGPFPTEPIDLGKKALCIEAAAGFSPRITFSVENPQPKAKGTSFHCIESQAPLILQGLTLERVRPTMQQKVWVDLVFSSSTLHVGNCRFVGSSEKTIGIRTEDGEPVSIFGSEFLGELYESIKLVRPSPGVCRIENNVIHSRVHGFWIVTGSQPAHGVHLLLRSNTFLGCVPFNAEVAGNLSDLAGSLKGKKSYCFRLDASQNILGGGTPFYFAPSHQSLTLKAAVPLLPEIAIFRDDNNLYPKRKFMMVNRWGDTGFWTIDTLQEWHRFWGITDSNSTEGVVSFERGDVVARAKDNSAQLTPADFRLAKGSPGQGVLPGGKDLGADVDLVGPGEAYERWKKTPAYQEWRKKTEELMRTTK